MDIPAIPVFPCNFRSSSLFIATVYYNFASARHVAAANVVGKDVDVFADLVGKDVDVSADLVDKDVDVFSQPTASLKTISALICDIFVSTYFCFVSLGLLA